MAHFAKIGLNGKVMSVHVVADKDCLNADNVEDESVGQQYQERIHGWPAALWKQTSYNTHYGKHWTYDGHIKTESADQSKALRANAAGIGMIYDEDLDIFRWPQPYPSWTLNTTAGRWEPPTPKPSLWADTKKHYRWNESTLAWDEI